MNVNLMRELTPDEIEDVADEHMDESTGEIDLVAMVYACFELARIDNGHDVTLH